MTICVYNCKMRAMQTLQTVHWILYWRDMAVLYSSSTIADKTNRDICLQCITSKVIKCSKQLARYFSTEAVSLCSVHGISSSFFFYVTYCFLFHLFQNFRPMIVSFSALKYNLCFVSFETIFEYGFFSVLFCLLYRHTVQYPGAMNLSLLLNLPSNSF